MYAVYSLTFNIRASNICLILIFCRNDKYLTEDEYIAQLEKDFKENTDFKDVKSKDQDETKISSYAADLERIFSGMNDHQDGFDEESNSLWDSGEYNWKEEKTYPNMYQSYKP